MATPLVIISRPQQGSHDLPIPRTRTRAIAAHVAANAIWAGSAVASKPLLDTMPPLTLAALRVAIAYALLRLVLAHRREQPAIGRVPAILGLTGVALFCGGMNLGLLFVNASVTSLLGGLIPLFTVLFAAMMLGERPGGNRIVGVVVSIAGIAIIVLSGTGEAPGFASLEFAMPLSSALGSAFYMVLGRRAMTTHGFLAIITGSTGYGLLFLLPGAVFELLTVGAGPLSFGDMLLLLYLGAGCSGIAFLLRGYGLAHLGASHGAVFGNLRPVIGVALAVILLREPLTGSVITGGALVLAGVAIANRRSRSRSEGRST